MTRRTFAALVLGTLVTGFSSTAVFSVMPPKDIVPDEKTALSVGLAVMEAIYGKAHVRAAPHYKVLSDGDAWVIFADLPPGILGGGFPEVRIAMALSR
jgi:hypothetical protein